MKSVIMTVLLLAVCVALVAGAVMPLANSVKTTSESAVSSINDLNSVIKSKP